MSRHVMIFLSAPSSADWLAESAVFTSCQKFSGVVISGIYLLQVPSPLILVEEIGKGQVNRMEALE